MTHSTHKYYNITYFRVNLLGCTDLYQICNPNKEGNDDERCTSLASSTRVFEEQNNLDFNPSQNSSRMGYRSNKPSGCNIRTRPKMGILLAKQSRSEATAQKVKNKIMQLNSSARYQHFSVFGLYLGITTRSVILVVGLTLGTFIDWLRSRPGRPEYR